MTEWVVKDKRHSAPGTDIEVRDPRGATQSMSWVGSGSTARPTIPQWDASNAFRHGYYASALVNRAINIIADTVSSLPFRAGADLDNPSDYNQNAQLARLLGPPPGTPNPESSARQLWKSAILNYLVAGRFAWEVERSDAETVLGLWPLNVGQLAPVYSSGGRAYFAGFEYTIDGALQPVKYKREEIVYAWRPAPDDPREPESALRSLALNVSVLVQVDQYNYAFMKNDAKPATLIVHGPFANADDKAAWQRQFLGNFRGPLNANKTLFSEVDPDEAGNVGGMLDIKQIGASAKDSQLVQIYEQQLDAITSGLGVPMSLMDASGRTFSNADREIQNFFDLTILPLCAELQDHINRDLAPKVGIEVGWFDLSKVQALKPRLTEGVQFSDVKDDMLLDERRSYAGLGPADLDALAAEKEMLTPELGADENPEPDPVVEDAAPEPAPAAPSPVPLPRARTRAELIEDAIELTRAVVVPRLAAVLDRQLAVVNVRSEKSTLARAEGKRGRQMLDKGESIDALYDRSHWYEETRGALAPFFDAAVTAASSVLAGVVPVDEDMDWWVDKRASDLAYALVEMRWNRMRCAAGPEATQESLIAEVRVAHQDAGLVGTSVDMAETAFDDAVRQLSGVSRATVRDLLTRLTAGDVDLNRAMGELTA